MTGLIIAVLICGLGPTTVAFGLTLAIGLPGTVALALIVIAVCMAEDRMARRLMTARRT